MNWKEIEVRTTHQAYPAVNNLLEELQVAGISKEELDSGENEIVIKAYLEAKKQKLKSIIDQLEADIFSLQQYNLDVGSGKIKTRQVKKKDWANKWKENFHPIQLTDKIVIKPTWETYTPQQGEIVIEIDPGQAFGTGYHATTEGCLQLIEEYLSSGINFLDLGCGTGILSIAAVKLGAKSGLGVDIDAQAIEVARENARVNGADNELKFIQGDLTAKVNAKYELVTANILPEIILELIPDLNQVIAENGCFILSGIIADKEKEVKDKLHEFGFVIEKIIQNEEWITLAGVRSE